jgi:creatinine amidohydrolase
MSDRPTTPPPARPGAAIAAASPAPPEACAPGEAPTAAPPEAAPAAAPPEACAPGEAPAAAPPEVAPAALPAPHEAARAVSEAAPSDDLPLALGALSTDALAAALARPGGALALVPVGSTEPHGPHLPLATDALLSEGVAARAVRVLRARGRTAFVAPAVAYGVTDFARGFAGALSVPAAALSAFLRAIAEALLGQGFVHVCLVNNHLEPAHAAAVRAATEGFGPRASVACPLTRRWARTLGDEFKSGACHAGRYETSALLAIAPDLVDLAAARALPDLDASLSDAIRRGVTSFQELGLRRAYTGRPRLATADEGRELVERLAHMVVTEVEEGLASLASRGATRA